MIMHSFSVKLSFRFRFHILIHKQLSILTASLVRLFVCLFVRVKSSGLFYLTKKTVNIKLKINKMRIRTHCYFRSALILLSIIII
jgi:hypothetical protein